MFRKQESGPIPVVDLGQLGIDNEDEPCEREWMRVAEEISLAFGNVGFVYMSGHGIQNEHVDSLVKASSKFFDLPQEKKDKYLRHKENYHGYVPVNTEKLDPSFQNEMRESYNMRSADGCFPDDEVPGFREASRDFLDSCNKLVHRILTAMSLGLGLRRNFFSDAHRLLCREGNSSVARVLFYPPVPADKLINSTKCGEHTDYGTLTLLFQDEMGGLQVCGCSGNWINADFIPGTVLVNIGDLLQLWTSGKFKATKHRVIIPEDEARRRKCRRSVVYFVHPDDSLLIEPLDGSMDFRPITSKRHLEDRVAETYGM